MISEKKETPNLIIDNLYLGSEEDGHDIKKLQKHKIKYILVVGNFLTCKFPTKFKYKHLKVNDDPFETVDKYFDEAFKFMKEGIKAGGCLVHCYAGVSRSASFIIAFMMTQNKWTLNEAYKYVHDRRDCVYPNYGFQKQLKNVELKLGLISQEEFDKEVNSDKLYFIDDSLTY